jgi:hypothetical protein
LSLYSFSLNTDQQADTERSRQPQRDNSSPACRNASRKLSPKEWNHLGDRRVEAEPNPPRRELHPKALCGGRSDVRARRSKEQLRTYGTMDVRANRNSARES